ncbi:hypothetical protein TNCV_3781311 [Trichonephila clavipes]|nr:hypothetical protein TNCV_3781311 [Trichonephila clavipes]
MCRSVRCYNPHIRFIINNFAESIANLVWLVEGEEKWEAPGYPQGFLPLNRGGTEKNRTVIRMVLKAKANDRRKLPLVAMNFAGLNLTSSGRWH